MRRLVLTLFLVALGPGLVGVVPAAARDDKKDKTPHPCKVLLPADLEPIFEQPFKKGVDGLAGNCVLTRPDGADVPDIQVSLILVRRATEEKAAKDYARGEEVTRELATATESIKGMGDDAVLATLLGVDVLSMRVDRYLVEVRVDQPDDSEATFRDQALAVADLVEARLLPAPSRK